MKKDRFSDAQKAFILKQAEEGVPIGNGCRKAGISGATFYSWRKKHAGMTPPEMRRLKALEDENARLKKLVAELSLDCIGQQEDRLRPLVPGKLFYGVVADVSCGNARLPDPFGKVSRLAESRAPCRMERCVNVVGPPAGPARPDRRGSIG